MIRACPRPCPLTSQLRQRPRPSASTSPRSKSGEPRISRPRSRLSRVGSTRRVRLNTLSLVERLPTMHSLRELVEVGGLMSCGANFPDLFRRAADLVDKILRGAKPADIPVEQPTKFDFVINLVTANALGLEVPATLLARADEVIE